MDYGQLAYTKVQELETYLNRSDKSDNRTYASASYHPHAAFDHGFEPCSVAGTGVVGLSIVMAVRAPQGAADAKIKLYCGDKFIGYTSVTLPAGGSGEYTVLATVYPGYGEKIRAVSESESLLLDGISVLADGAAVSVSSEVGGCKCDCTGGAVYMAKANDGGYLMLYKCGTDLSTDVAHCTEFDIVASDNRVNILCCDDNYNLWGITYDTELNEIARVYLGSGMDKVALGLGTNGLILAGISERKMYFAECGSKFTGITGWEPADFEATADEVYLTKQTMNPVLLFKRDGTLYAKIPTEACRVRSCISMVASLQLNKV